MKSAVVVFPGINHEHDMARALNLASAADKLLANTVIENYRVEV
jgi:phosphoribosylformylglycinamidine (FGAM) synthase PurS component